MVCDMMDSLFVKGTMKKFDDLINIDSLYKSNYQKFSKKDVADE